MKIKDDCREGHRISINVHHAVNPQLFTPTKSLELGNDKHEFVTTALEMVDTAGIEPASLLCRRSILPLNYRPIEIILVDPVGNDPTTVWVWARCSNQLS